MVNEEIANIGLPMSFLKINV